MPTWQEPLSRFVHGGYGVAVTVSLCIIDAAVSSAIGLASVYAQHAIGSAVLNTVELGFVICEHVRVCVLM